MMEKGLSFKSILFVLFLLSFVVLPDAAEAATRTISGGIVCTLEKDPADYCYIPVEGGGCLGNVITGATATSPWQCSTTTWIMCGTMNCSPTVNGGCGYNVNSCATGTYSDVADTRTEFRWRCLGAGNPRGTDSSTCSVDKEEFNIRSVAGTGGRIWPSGETTVMEGESQSYVIRADEGYEIDKVFVNNIDQGAISGYAFSNVSRNYVIRATFAALPSAVDGRCHPSFADSCLAGTYSDAPDTTTDFVWDCLGIAGGKDKLSCTYPKSWDGRCGSTRNNCLRGSFVDEPDSNTHYRWTCTGTGDPKGADRLCSEPKGGGGGSHTVDVITGPGCTVTPAGPQLRISEGGDQAFTIAGQSGYNVADVIVDGLSLGPQLSHMFSNIDTDHTIEARCSTGPVTTFNGYNTAGSYEQNSVINLPIGGGQVRLQWSVADAVGGSCTGYSTTGLPGWSVTGTGGKSSGAAFFGQMNFVNISSTTRFDLDCWNAVGVAADRKQVQVNVPDAPTLHVCPSSATLPTGGTQSFTAWHSAGGVAFGSCFAINPGSTNVTGLTSWSSTDTTRVTIASTGLATGVAPGNPAASINAVYGGVHATSVPVSVTNLFCVPRQCDDVYFSAQASLVCTSGTFTAPNGCPGNGTVTCPGTRSCDYNWREVAP